jgi:predicted nucleotidyltransferase
MVMNNFGLPQNVYDEMVNALNRFPEIKHAKIFGSRAKGTHKRYSDVDIAVFAEANPNLAADIKDVLDNLDTIYDFDVLHYEMTSSAEIKAHIDRVGIEIALKEFESGE